MVVHPQYGVYAKGSTIHHQTGLSFDAKQSTAVPRELRSRSFRAGGTVLDAAFLPASGEIAYLTKGNASVQAVAVGTGAQRVLGAAPKGARELEVDPTGQQIFLGGSDELVQMDAQGEAVARMKLPSRVHALAFDPGAGLGKGRIASITADRNLRRHVPGSLAASAPARLAKALVEGSGPLSAIFDPSGRLLLRRGASSRIAIRGAGVRRRKLPALRGAGGLAIGDRGTLVTVIGGRLVELSQAGRPVRNSGLSGRPARGRILQVTRSGSDVPAEQARQLIDQRTINPHVPEMAP